MAYDIVGNSGLMVIDIRHLLQPSPDSIRWGLDLTDPATLVQADMDRISNIFRDAIKPLFDNGWVVGPTALYFRPAADLAVLNDGTTEAGTLATAASSSPQVATIITKRTALVGVKNRGRVYLPGLPEADVDELGGLTSTWITTVTTAFNGLMTSLAADAAVDGSRIIHSVGVVGTNPAVTSIQVQPKCGTIRRRVRR